MGRRNLLRAKPRPKREPCPHPVLIGCHVVRTRVLAQVSIPFSADVALNLILIVVVHEDALESKSILVFHERLLRFVERSYHCIAVPRVSLSSSLIASGSFCHLRTW